MVTTFVVLLFVVGCNVSFSGLESQIEEEFENIIGLSNDDETQENSKKEDENQEAKKHVDYASKPFDYIVKKKHGIFVDVVRNFDNFQDYIEFFSNNTFIDYIIYEDGTSREVTKYEYDEDFFLNSGIIIFGKWETSGSIQVEVSSVELDENNNVTINVTRSVPEIGTCDMRYHLYYIEYQKPSESIKDIIIVYKNVHSIVTSFNIKDETSVEKIENFIEEKNEDIYSYQLSIYFIHDENISELSNEEKRVFFERFNLENIEKYGLENINGQLWCASYFSYVSITYKSLKDISLDLLLEIAPIDNLINIYLEFGHYVVK